MTAALVSAPVGVAARMRRSRTGRAKACPRSRHEVHGYRADRVVDAQVLERVGRPDDHEARDDADEERPGGAHPVTGAGDRHEAREESVGREAEIPFLHAGERVEERRQACRTRRHCRVEGHAADTLRVHRRQRAAGVEPVPAEPQDQAADRAEDDVVRQHGAAAVTGEHAAKTRAERDGAGE